MLQNLFQSFFVTAEKPGLGLAVTVAAGFTNIVLDTLFVAVFDFRLAGAAVATSISQFIGGILPVLYFSKRNSSRLRFTKTKFYGSVLLHTCTNGSSELMSNISASVVTMLYNYQLLIFAGEDGVAAYGVIMYVGFIFASIFIGYVVGSAPIISYNYGAGNKAELKNMFKKSLIITSFGGIIMAAAGMLFAPALSYIFTGYDQNLYLMTVRGFRVFSLSFLFSGLNIFGSGLFTALNNGPVSAAISFLRTLVFQTASILILPIILKIDGIWLASVAAEIFAFTVTAGFTVARRKKYEYV